MQCSSCFQLPMACLEFWRVQSAVYLHSLVKLMQILMGKMNWDIFEMSQCCHYNVVSWLSLLLSQHGKREVAWHQLPGSVISPNIMGLFVYISLPWFLLAQSIVFVFFFFSSSSSLVSQITRQFISTLMDSRKSLVFSLYTGRKYRVILSSKLKCKCYMVWIFYEGQLSDYMSWHFNNFLSRCFSFQCFAWKQLCANSSYLAALALGHFKLKEMPV